MTALRRGGSIATVPQTALELLRLLAQDAPADRIDEQARRLAAADPENAGVARDLALRVRADIDARRRREAELSALVDTAQDLASVAEPRGVLDAIVRRARSLLGTDVAYLTLADAERGDTFMRATAGSVSARFQALRLPQGAGLGGLVAQTRLPYWTADYPSDERYAHTREIDSAVDEEGLVAICGTPLLVDGEFVGVLFAANRSRRAFTSGEVSLLGSLAALAAVSLVQARRAAETSDALAALSAAHARISQAAAAHDRFAGVVLSGGGVEDIVAVLGELLGCWVVVLDVDDTRVAAHGPAPQTLPQEAIRLSTASGRLAGAEGTWAVVVRAAGHRLGTLVLGGRADLDSGEGRTVERAAMVTALVLLFRLRAAEADQRGRTELLADLLARDPGTPDAALLERGRLLGLALQQPHVVLVCRGRCRRLLVAAADAGDGRGLAGQHGGEIVAVVPGKDPSAVAAGLSRRLGEDGSRVTVGAAGPVTPDRGLRAAHAEARRTVEALTALGRRAGSTHDLGFAGLLAGRPDDVGAYLERVLGPVAEYDERRGSDLLGTLEAWFAAGSSPRHAAAALHVHVNTVTQRLERVAALLGPDWTDPDRTLELQLALRLRRLRADRV